MGSLCRRGGRLTISTTTHPALTSRDFARVLLIKPSSLGDIVHALPVLHGLRCRYPHAHVAWLVGTSFVPLLADHPALSEVIPFDRRHYGRVGRSWPATRDFLRFLRELRSRRFDLVIDLQGLFRSGLLTRATGAKVRIGFADARELAWMAYTHRLPAAAGDVHAVDRNRQTLALLGVEEGPAVFDLALQPQERAAAGGLLAAAGIQPDEPFLAVLPGARWETKQWPPERFGGTINQIADQVGVRSVLLGGAEERVLCDQIAEICLKTPVNLAGRTGLRELIALIERAAVVLCHDSGPMHVAAALKRPLVCISGPTNPRRTGPYGQPEAVIRLDLPCSPCYLRRLSQCRHEHRCMRELEVEAVVGRLRHLFERTGGDADT